MAIKYGVTRLLGDLEDLRKAVIWQRTTGKEDWKIRQLILFASDMSSTIDGNNEPWNHWTEELTCKLYNLIILII